MKDFLGMKVLSIDPGCIHWDPVKEKWYYTILVNGKTYFGAGHHHTAATAKQHMRETVRRLRKKHLIGGSNGN